VKERLEGSVLFVSTGSTAANFVLFTHKAAVHSYNFDAKRASLSFRVLQGLSRACGRRDCGGALFLLPAAGTKQEEKGCLE
jgi:hypothetical protein